MKRVKIVLFSLLCLAMITLCFFACTDKNNDPGEGESTQIPPVTITAGEDGISFSHPDIHYFFFALDGGERDETLSDGVVDYSNTVGKHTIRVFGLDLTGKEIGVAQYSYTTVAVALSDISVSGKTVSWAAKARRVLVKDGTDFIPVTGNDYTTEIDSGSVRVRAEGGFDVATNTYYTGDSVTKSATIVSSDLTVLASPVISVELEALDPEEVQRLALPSWSISVKRVKWTTVSSATKYAVSYDDGAFNVATTATLSDDVGRHTIRVKAVGDGERYEDSVPAVYQYETVKSADPDVRKSDFNVATIGFDAPACYYSVDNFSYQAIEDFVSDGNKGKTKTYLFNAGESVTYYFRAWGFDAANKINYVVSDPVSVPFLAPATREYVLEDGVSSEIASRWTAEKKAGNAWAALTDRVSYGRDYEKTSVMKWSVPLGGGEYRFSTELDVTRACDYLSFRYCGDGASRVRLMLSSDEGYYVERDLGILPDYWQVYTLRLDAAEWMVGGTDLSLAALWEKLDAATIRQYDIAGLLSNFVSILEIYPRFNTLSFLIETVDGRGDLSTHLADDLLFGYDAEIEDGILQPLFALGNSFVAEEEVNTVRNEILFFLDEDDACRIYSTALEKNFVLSGKYVLDEKNATVTVQKMTKKPKAEGEESAEDEWEIIGESDFKIVLSLTRNGAGAVVVEAIGAQAAHFLACKPFVATANLSESFVGESDEEYDEDKWTAYSISLNGEASPLTSSHIFYDERDGLPVLRLSVGKDMHYRFLFKEPGSSSSGLANNIGIYLGNCMDEAAPLSIKIIAVDADGFRHYLMGSEGAFGTISVTDGLQLFSVPPLKAITFSALEIEVRNNTENALAYLYVGDLSVTYKADPSLFSGYPEPTIHAEEGLFTFVYEEENAVFEYSLNDGEWIEATNCNIPFVAGNYKLCVRALIGEDRAPSKIATYPFKVEEVYVKAVSVFIEEKGQRATWESNGKISIFVGDVDSVDQSGEYQALDMADDGIYDYVTAKNAMLHIRAEGYRYQDRFGNDVYCVGTQEVSKKILVDIVLDAPVVMGGQEGLYWDAVDDANAYSVSVNGGDYVTREDLRYPFAISEGTYVVRVMSVRLDDQGEVSAYSNYIEYTYSVMNVTLSPLAKEKATVSWQAVAYKAYLKVDVADFTEQPLSGSFRATAVGANQITIKAIAGYDEENRIYYYAAKDVTRSATVEVKTLSAPTILVNASETGLYWAFVTQDPESGAITQITTIQDYASTYPEVTYRISINGGAWAQATEYPFPETPGEYSVRVMTVGNGENLRDSESSEPYTFTVRAVSLVQSEKPNYIRQAEKENGGSMITFDYTALHVYEKIGENGVEKETVATTFETKDKTVLYSLRVVGGWDDEDRIFYAGREITQSWNVIVPIKLLPPILSHSENGVSWSVVKHQEKMVTGYKLTVKRNGELFDEKEYTNLSSYSFADYGVYEVTVQAVNPSMSEQYPESEAAAITYSVVEVYLSSLRLDGAVVRWDYRALNLYLAINDVYDMANPYNDTSFANENGADVKISVKVSGGYDYEKVVMYRGSADPQHLDIQYSELLSPKLSVHQAGDKLVWDEVSQAGGYAYKTLSPDASDEDIETAIENGEGWIATDGCKYDFEADEAEHLVLIKAVHPENSTITDSAPSVWRYTSSSIYLSDIEVVNGVASWSKRGFTSMRTYPTLGSPIGMTDFEVIEKTTYAPTATIYVDIRCRAGYDAANDVYYHDETIQKTEKIIVPIYLEKPTVQMETAGIILTNVDNADAYKVSVNGGEYEVYDADRIEYSDAVGSYTVRIRACNTDQPEQYPDSEDVTVVYDVRTVSLSAITAENVSTAGGDAHFTADGLLSIGTNGTDYEPLLLDYSGATYTYDYHLTDTKTVYVKAACGVRVLSETKAVKYVGDKDLATDKKIIIPITLAKPTLNETSTILEIRSVTNADNYLVSVDGGAFTPQTATTVAYATAIGDHSISVKAHSTRGDGQYLDSEVATVSYKTVAVALSDITVSGATFSWTATAHTVKRKVGSASAVETTSNSYTATASTTLKVSAYGGYRSNTYYYGSTIDKSASVTIVNLGAPALSVSGKNITWSAVSNAKEYAIRVNSGSWSYQTGTTYALASQAGSYTVKVKAVNRSDDTVLDSSESSITYTTKTVTLSNISVSGSTATWSATAYKTYLKVGSGSYAATTATSYTPTSEGTFAIKVKAEGGWDASSNIYYYASAAIEKSASVTLATLAKPTLTTNSKGVTWAAVSNASTYSVKVDNGSYKNQSDKSVAFSTSVGTHTVYVKAIAAANSGYQDSAAASFTYETKQTSFSFLTSSATRVTWAYTGLKAQYSTNGGSSFTDTTLTGYTATATGSVSFRAVGGWDAAGAVFYNGTTSAQSKSFTLPGLCIANNFEGSVSGWTKEVYNTSWATSNNIVISSVTDAYGAGSAIKFKTWLNGMAYRIGYQFGDLPASYKSLSFDVKLNDVDASGTSLRFQDSASGTYVDYKLSNLSLSPGIWYHVKVGFEDSNLIINSGGSEYTAPKAKKLLGEKSFYEKIKALDKMYITVKGSTNNGVTVQTYFDNFQFSTETCSSASKTAINPIELTYTDGTVDAEYTNSKWKQYEYKNNGYSATNLKLKIENAEGDKVLSLYAGYSTYKITYNEGGSSLGTFNHFAIDLGCESAATVKYRIELVCKDGSVIYAAGGAETMATIASPAGNAGLKTLTFNFAAKEIKSITIYASAGNGNGHLFMDNLTLSKLS